MNSINLLPGNIKKDIKQSKENKKTLSRFWKSLFLLLLTLFLVTAFSAYFNYRLSSSQVELSEKKKSIEAYGNLESETRAFSEKLDKIVRIEENINHWSGTLEEISRLMPSGAYLSTLGIDSETKSRSRITGFADSKDTVAFLRNTLENSDRFEYVNIESSVVAQDPAESREVENFTITFSLKKEALSE